MGRLDGTASSRVSSADLIPSEAADHLKNSRRGEKVKRNGGMKVKRNGRMKVKRNGRMKVKRNGGIKVKWG